MPKCSFAGNANQNIIENPTDKSGEASSDLGPDGLPRHAHSADECLTAEGVVCQELPQTRPYKGLVQTTPGHTYEVE